jgi:hypothetical protein
MSISSNMYIPPQKFDPNSKLFEHNCALFIKIPRDKTDLNLKEFEENKTLINLAAKKNEIPVSDVRGVMTTDEHFNYQIFGITAEYYTNLTKLLKSIIPGTIGRVSYYDNINRCWTDYNAITRNILPKLRKK